jgi:hypothetical protein
VPTELKGRNTFFDAQGDLSRVSFLFSDGLENKGGLLSPP